MDTDEIVIRKLWAATPKRGTPDLWDPGFSYDGQVHLANDPYFKNLINTHVVPQVKPGLRQTWKTIQAIETVASRHLRRIGFGMKYGVLNTPAETSVKLKVINMPIREAWHDANAFYSALLHELTHSTLDISGRHTWMFDGFFNIDTSLEEMVACFGECILMNRLGQIPNYANEGLYVRDWLDGRQFPGWKDDASFLRDAFTDAIEAADYIYPR